ncbi:hypothetical protein, variant [Verruconis gallopava]|uniref:Carboxylic ester hydrolase n=1 Tax=Verruconis gallopava TaxID=253628 RepID=A0A0D2AR30_9PEZI|nr:hypothetical protein, variant [Verruconis gallopava]KIW01659.1 hypothetical protein, variant [Verruconis gallopava]
MKFPVFVLKFLLAFDLFTYASAVRLDVSRNGRENLRLDTSPVLDSHDTHNNDEWSEGGVGKVDSSAGDEYIVDIWPGKHKGFLIDDNEPSYIRWSNIQYGEAPVGELRFSLPVKPWELNENVNEGKDYKICPQHKIGWLEFAQEFGQTYALSTGSIPPKWNYPISPANNYTYPIPPERSSTLNVTEDCLYLDVMVPKKVWDERDQRSFLRPAVIVWIHGGGFVFGHKNQHGSPIGLFQAAESKEEQNVIYVTLNYRLGAFGFLGGDKYLDDGGYANLGLQDQLLALRWVQENIGVFGGDPGRVTVMGQSAGASSILHHITSPSFFRSSRSYFQKAILLSPGFYPQPNLTLEDIKYTKFLEASGKKSMDELIAEPADSPALLNANAELTYNSSYGLFYFGPNIDGLYVTDLPGKLLAKGNFQNGISLLLGYTRNDGVAFTPPWLRSSSDLRGYVKTLFPGTPEETMKFVDDNYPFLSGESEKDKIRHVADFLDDLAIQCNTHYLTNATVKYSRNKFVRVYRYVFNAFPAFHGTDADYIYYPEKPLLGAFPWRPLAQFMQRAIVDFVRYIDPNPEGVKTWEAYTDSVKKVMNFGSPHNPFNFSTAIGPDLLDAAKCEYWQNAPFYPQAQRVDNDIRRGEELVIQTDL